MLRFDFNSDYSCKSSNVVRTYDTGISQSITGYHKLTENVRVLTIRPVLFQQMKANTISSIDFTSNYYIDSYSI